MRFKSKRPLFFLEIFFFFKRRNELKLRLFRRICFSILGINYRGSVSLRDTKGNIHCTNVTRYEMVTGGILSQKIDGLNHFFEERNEISVKNAVINVANGSIFLRDPSKKGLRLIEESVIGNPIMRLIEEESRYHRVHKLGSGKIKLGIMSRNYFHAVIEEVPRLLKSNVDTPALLGSNGSWLGNEIYRDSKLILSPTKNLIEVDEIDFISSGFDSGYLHPEDFGVLRNFQMQVCVKDRNLYPKKVYISRLNSRRSPINENQVARIFERYGFTIIEPSSKTLVEQMTYFSNVSHIAGISGAGLVNTLWGQDAKLLEIMPLDRINRCFEFMCSISNQKYELFTFQSHKFPIDLVELELRINSFI